MATSILVLAEVQDGKIKKATFELLSKARELAKNLDAKVHCALLGQGVEGLAGDTARYGADLTLIVDQNELKNYSSGAYAKALEAAIKESAASVVLASASALGRDLLPKIATRLNVPIAPDCVELTADGKRLRAKRPLYAGKVIAELQIPEVSPQIFTCRPNSFQTVETKGEGATKKLSVSFSPKDLRAQVKEVIKGKSDKADLTEAEVIVSGGRSLANAENFKILDELAEALGAAVGASRAAVDAGYAPHAMQVGQTGKTVNPKLYIACGISGAIQHLAGMRTSKVIVAINKDPEAPIFKIANYGIVDDLFKVVPLLTKHLKEALSQ